MPKGAFSIGEIGQYDKYKTTHTTFSINFDDSVDKTAETDEERKNDMQPCSRSGVNIWMIQRLLKNVAGDWIKNLSNMNSLSTVILLKRRKSGGASFHILSLYDHLLVCNKDVPLFNRFASREVHAAESLLALEQNSATGLTPGDKFPLAKAQRDALSHFLDAKHGDILC